MKNKKKLSQTEKEVLENLIKKIEGLAKKITKISKKKSVKIETDEIKIGEIILASKKLDAKELSELGCELLKKHEVKEYLGLIKNKKALMGNMGIG